MRVVIQKVTHASVDIEKQTVASINKGLLVLVGIEDNDTDEDIVWLSAKIVNLRVFEDENDVMNLSVKDVDGEVLVVSQFTLHAATKKGNRPSYIRAARPEVAIPIYEAFVRQVETLLGKQVPTGQFGAMMQVNLCNDGPVTILIDTKNKDF
ncbi:D-aminoacyl-tRNA deacylase [Capnocytophaga sputigena]|jgi:D-tyrosyl-tRNA(Tyr) deacylase|uniref:D-aminoacyl-tRNA deacylase n=1 Tax=Capnocytophaga sputigena TaxID=1019 RepID=UPI0028E96208|nr:D-aminoacyl-tRNA deacylase [Capnocytophaga sputigena]